MYYRCCAHSMFMDRILHETLLASFTARRRTNIAIAHQA
jgi:hypothetical protein